MNPGVSVARLPGLTAVFRKSKVLVTDRVSMGELVSNYSQTQSSEVGSHPQRAHTRHSTNNAKTCSERTLHHGLNKFKQHVDCVHLCASLPFTFFGNQLRSWHPNFESHGSRRAYHIPNEHKFPRL